MLCGVCSEKVQDNVINLVSKATRFSRIYCTCSYEVTPPNQKYVGNDEEFWKAKSEDYLNESTTTYQKKTVTPQSETNKSKGVRKYLRKCRNVFANDNSCNSNDDCKLSSFKSNSSDTNQQYELNETRICASEIHDIDIDEIFEIGIVKPLDEIQVSSKIANIVYANWPTDNNSCYNATLKTEKNIDEKKGEEEEEEEEEEDTFYSLPTDSQIEQANSDKFLQIHTYSVEAILYSTEPKYNVTTNENQCGPTNNFQTALDDIGERVIENVDQKMVEKKISSPMFKIKLDLEYLVDKYFQCIYENYNKSKKCLMRQARDLLVCEFHGCLDLFEMEFCRPISKLLQKLKNECERDKSTSSSGWPFCLGQSGIILHLANLDPIHVHNGDCYLCCRKQSDQSGPEVVFIYKIRDELRIHKIAKFHYINSLNSNLDAISMCSSIRSVTDLEEICIGACLDDCNCADLPELLQNLLVSVEYAIKKVPLEDLPFPCPQCNQYLPLDQQEENDNHDEAFSASCACQCLCRISDNQPVVTKQDNSMQTSPMFEFDGTIPHIDSDSDDDRETHKSGFQHKKTEISVPKTISELPDKLLMSGISLPGTTDRDERPIILCYAENITRAVLNKYEIAKLLLYYTSIPNKRMKKNGFTMLLLAENKYDSKVVELLNKSIGLIGNSIDIKRCLIWSPASRNKNISLVRTLTSHIETTIITEESTLDQYLHKEETPASCGGTCNHDQLEWVEFFKQLEPFVVNCRRAGKSLLSTLAQLRTEEPPPQITRKFLNHQCRQITKAIDADTVQKIKREGNKTLNNLIERSQWLSSSRDVKKAINLACDSFEAVDRVTRRLEQLKMERMNRLKELVRYRMLQEEAEELQSWNKQVGETTLNNLTLVLRDATDSAGVKQVANTFDELFFNAWKQIEKSNDLLKECKNIEDAKGQHVKDITENLHFQMQNFKENLEETRERIEHSSRCFLLLESCHDILEDDNKEQEEFIQLAQRSGNEKLLEICKNTKKFMTTDSTSHTNQLVEKLTSPTDGNPSFSHFDINASSTPHKPQNTQIRRRSVSSMAYIYHCSHHAAGELCNCYESEMENSMSYKLKKKYIQMQAMACQCGNRDMVEKKNSSSLGGIKEECESAENILNKLETLDNFRRSDSGFSTITDHNSIGDDSLNSFMNFKKKLQMTCSCQYYRERCTMCSSGATTSGSSSAGSNQDNNDNQQDSITEEGSDGFNKSSSSDDIEDDNYVDERRKIPPVSANNHLYCHSSNLDLPSDALYINMDPKTQKTLKYIINEMIDTERDYVKSLDYIIVNYISELQREDIPQALRGQRNTVFGNVEKIYEFHSHHFLCELEECENNPLQVGNIFLKYDKKFYLYALYNKNKPKSDSLMSEYGTSFFKSKQLDLGDKMDLASYLLKPVQRMGKYALLLQQMMKACTQSLSNATERVVQELEDLRQAEEMVRFQLRHGNDLLAMDSIRECDVNLKEQGRLLRQNEFLVWEGRTGKKSLRQVFLFEELILFSKARRFPDRKNLDLYIYKNSIKMTDIGLTARIGESPTKFEIWFRKRKPNDTFTLQSMSEDVKKAWAEELSQLLWKQAIKNRAIRMAEMSSMGIGNKPCLDIRPSADQINDRSISFAQLSKTAPRFRNSIVAHTPESCRTTKRPHSVISMSSVSSSSTSSGGSAGNSITSQSGIQSNSIGFDSNFDSSRASYNNRSSTLNSQCSIESGIISDASIALEEFSSTETNQQQLQPNG